MKEIILKSKNVICGCGQSINELLYLKANFFPIVIADNQINNCKSLIKLKILNEVSNWKDKKLDKKIKIFFLQGVKSKINLKNGVKKIINNFLGGV